MNNLQYIIENDMRAAWHIAVELCERGDFDDVEETVRWLMQERKAAMKRGECKVIASSTDDLMTAKPQQWFLLSCGHSFKLDGLNTPVGCPVCGKEVKR